MQAEGDFDEVNVICGEVADDGWEPRLVLEFEQLKPWNRHFCTRAV